MIYLHDLQSCSRFLGGRIAHSATILANSGFVIVLKLVDRFF